MMKFAFGMQVNIKVYQIFLIDLWKVGASWILERRESYKRGGSWSRKGAPFTNYAFPIK